MALTTIGIFALIFAIVASIKILVILIKPKAWTKVVKNVWKTPLLTGFISLVLAALVFYYLVYKLGFTLTHIFAIMLFTALLAGVSISVYAKEISNIATKMLKKDLLKKAWLPLLIWVALLVWYFITAF